MSATGTIASPCIGVCLIDAEHERCHGCQRTLTEIAAWTGYSDAERATIMAELPARHALAGNPYEEDDPEEGGPAWNSKP